MLTVITIWPSTSGLGPYRPAICFNGEFHVVDEKYDGVLRAYQRAKDICNDLNELCKKELANIVFLAAPAEQVHKETLGKLLSVLEEPAKPPEPKLPPYYEVRDGELWFVPPPDMFGNLLKKSYNRHTGTLPIGWKQDRPAVRVKQSIVNKLNADLRLSNAIPPVE